jgi:ABC-type Fe3+ transport system substrate-binding protein
MKTANTPAAIFLRELAIIKPSLTAVISLCLVLIFAGALHAATMAEVSANLAKLNAQQKRDFLVKGAQAERGGALTTQVVATGEFPIGIAVNGKTSSAIRDEGSPLGFKLLTPKIVKPEGFFLMKNAPRPHAATIFAEWALAEKAQSFLAATLGKGTAMKGVKSKYQEFQVQPDYVVTPKLGPKLNDYLKEFRQVMGIQ